MVPHHLNKNLKSLKGERWKTVPEFEFYMVSNFGRVKSLERKVERGTNSYLKKERVLSGVANKYLFVEVSMERKIVRLCIHKLVATVFVKNTSGNKIVRHKNGITTDNRAVNLEWSSGSMKGCTGEAHHRSKKILQYNMDGSLKKEWESLKAIGQALRISVQNISLCCKGKQKSSNGYVWRFRKARLVKKIIIR